MKKGILFYLFMTGLVMIGINPSVLFAEEEAPTASADVAFLSKYVWRGYGLSNESMVIQPSVTVGYKGFGLNLWGNLDTDLDDGDPAVDNSNKLNETDITISYDTEYENWKFGIGFIYYAFDSALDTKEFYFSAGYDTLLSPTLKVYRDIDTTPGWYLNFSAGHSFPLSEKYNLDIKGSIGYYSSDDIAELDDNYIATGGSYNDFHEATLSASIPIPIGSYVVISPSISYSIALSESSDNIISATGMGLFGEDDSDFLYGGITFSIAF